MKDEKISIEINSDKYSFIIKSGDISNLKIAFPLVSSISSEFKKDENGVYNLKIYDMLACFHLHQEKVNFGLRLNPISRKITIIVPNNWVTDLMVRLENGNLLLNDVVFDTLSINSIRGNVVVKDSYSEFTSIDGICSDICFKRVNGQSASLYSCTGNLKVYDIDFDKFDCRTETGDIKVKFLNKNLCGALFSVKDKKLSLNDFGFGHKKLKKRFSFTSDFGNFKSNLL